MLISRTLPPSGGSGGEGSFTVAFEATTTTLDATPTTCGSVTVPAATTLTLDTTVTVASASEGSSWRLFGTFRNGAGVVTQQGYTFVEGPTNPGMGVMVAYTVFGTDVRVTVTGHSESISWASRGAVQSI